MLKGPVTTALPISETGMLKGPVTTALPMSETGIRTSVVTQLWLQCAKRLPPVPPKSMQGVLLLVKPWTGAGAAAPRRGCLTSSVSSSRLTSTRTGSVMNLLVISSTSAGSVALTSTTCVSGGRYLRATRHVHGRHRTL